MKERNTKPLSYVTALLTILILAAGNAPAETMIENENIKLSISDEALLSFEDKTNGHIWRSDFIGWVELSNGIAEELISLSFSDVEILNQGSGIHLLFSGIKGESLEDDDFELEVEFSLTEVGFEMTVLRLETKFSLENLEYPAHLFTVESGLNDAYIVVPHLQGILIPSRYDVGFMRYGQNIWELIADQEKWWSMESGNLNMPWFGATIGSSSVMATALTSSDCMLHLIGNKVVDETGDAIMVRYDRGNGKRISSLAPIWHGSKGKLSYPRRLRIEFVDNGYVGMAKKYKEYARKSGRYVTLKQKIDNNPEYARIIGAPDLKIYCYTNRLNDPYYRAWSEPVLNGYSRLNTSFHQVKAISEELEEMGIEKCMILLGGWNRMGYDREHVDMWPPAELAGGVAGLKMACEAVRSKGYLFALHDNYDDFYPDAPTYNEKYILVDKNGSLHEGGVWDGGPCKIICPAQREQLLNRNMQLVQDQIPINGYYFDVVTSTSHYECYSPDHPITRKEDLEYRLSLLDNIVQRGLVVGGERGTDWAIPKIAFCEGLSGGGTGYHRGVGYRTGLTVPLFYLVYRECVVGYWQHGTPYGREDHANHVLLDVLYGQPSSWSIEYGQWTDLKDMFKQTYELLGRFHENTAHLSMIDHKYLSQDFMVQRTELSDGTAIWVNFGITTFHGNELNLPPKGFLIKRPDGHIISAIVNRNIEYIEQ